MSDASDGEASPAHLTHLAYPTHETYQAGV